MLFGLPDIVYKICGWIALLSFFALIPLLIYMEILGDRIGERLKNLEEK